MDSIGMPQGFYGDFTRIYKGFDIDSIGMLWGSNRYSIGMYRGCYTGCYRSSIDNLSRFNGGSSGTL